MMLILKIYLPPLVFEYTGESVNFQYFSEFSITDIGIMLFLDGIIQPFTIKLGNEILAEDVTQYSYKGGKNDGDKVLLDISFIPITGKKGDKLPLTTMLTLLPDLGNLSDEYSINGIIPHSTFHNYFTHPVFVTMNEDVVDNTKKANLTIESFTNKIIAEIFTAHFDISMNPNFKEYPRFGKALIDKQDCWKLAGNGKITVYCRFYGGVPLNRRVTFFVNNKQIQINGADYIDFLPKRNDYTIFSFELDMNELFPGERYATFFAVCNTIGRETQRTDIEQSFNDSTHRRLLVNEDIDKKNG